MTLNHVYPYASIPEVTFTCTPSGLTRGPSLTFDVTPVTLPSRRHGCGAGGGFSKPSPYLAGVTVWVNKARFTCPTFGHDLLSTYGLNYAVKYTKCIAFIVISSAYVQFMTSPLIHSFKSHFYMFVRLI